MIKLVTIVGARPQFIKAAAVSRCIKSHYSGSVQEMVVHTGQHFDDNMSQVFFDELNIPKPHHNLHVSGGGHGQMTGRMMEKIEALLIDEKPDWMLIYGDTNSTLAGALCAAKLHVPVAHVEAGLRSFNMKMPEEVNRILSDRVSSLLFCPTETAVSNLAQEGITAGVKNVGDVMFDVALYYKDIALEKSDILEKYDLADNSFVLSTCHRAENTDDQGRLENILGALDTIASETKVVLPLHPRTKNTIDRFGLSRYLDKLTVLEPVGFLDMIRLELASSLIITDSGGVQKEAFFHQKPCITTRDETEWVETVEIGANKLVGADQGRILEAYHDGTESPFHADSGSPYGSGKAAEQTMKSILEFN